MKDSIEDRLLSVGVKTEEVENIINNLARNVTPKDFDENYIAPNKLKGLCKLTKIKLKQLEDDYYRFVFSDYNNTILKYREQNNLSQKEFAQLISVSPNNILKWETRKTYPNRKQYRSLIELLN